MTETTGGWSYQMKDVDMGPDKVPGGEEWRIDAVVTYGTLSPTGSACDDCSGAPSPWVPAAGIDGHKATQHCEHDTKATSKSGVPYEYHSSDHLQCMGFKIPGKPGPIGWAGGQTIYPVNYCDDCHGCDGCKIRAPIFFGARPARSGGHGNNAWEPGPNAPTGLTKTQIPDVEVSSVAAAVFDNILIINGSSTKRLDSPSYPENQKIQDRYFEFALKRGVEIVADAWDPTSGTKRRAIEDDPDSGYQFGAHYERIMSELVGRDGYLGTMTWTAYPTKRRKIDANGNLVWATDQGLQFEVALHGTSLEEYQNAYYKAWQKWVEGKVAVAPASLLKNATDPKVRGHRIRDAVNAQGIRASDDGNGIRFGNVPLNSGTATTDSDMLVLEVRLQDANKMQDLMTPGGGAPPPAFKRPLRETPLFDDLTLTIVLRSPDLLYAEEGVEN